MKVLTERQIRRREDILSAARQLISERGYDGVTMRDLANASCVSLKTLYHQYYNKENLLLTAVEERFRHVYQAINDADITRGIERLFYIIDQVGTSTTKDEAYARALVPMFQRGMKGSTFAAIRM
ncbi:MAG: helix-turn-helix domain containing protein, partial [Proteobacteria bacterium]|nr:helix-turn-helix domain containing protein [Pseudomonadota bacterium]